MMMMMIQMFDISAIFTDLQKNKNKRKKITFFIADDIECLDILTECIFVII